MFSCLWAFKQLQAERLRHLCHGEAEGLGTTLGFQLDPS